MFTGLRPQSAEPALIHPECDMLLVMLSGAGACLRNASVAWTIVWEDDSDRFVKAIQIFRGGGLGEVLGSV